MAVGDGSSRLLTCPRKERSPTGVRPTTALDTYPPDPAACRRRKGSTMTLLTRRVRWAPTVLLATVALIGATTLTGINVATGETAPATSSGVHPHAMRADRSERVALQKAMRVLWEQHMEWTYATVAAFSAGTPGLTATLDRLLQNQTDIGDAIKPFYGKKAGNALTELLRTHITEAVPVLTAAQSGDQAALTAAITAWKANARQIADFLAAANPHWGKVEMRKMMATHIDQTVAYAAAQLQGDYTRSIRIYGRAEHRMLRMADMVSRGIVAQFPGRF